MNDGGKYIFTFLDKDEDGLFKDMAEHADVVEFWPSHREDTRFNKPFLWSFALSVFYFPHLLIDGFQLSGFHRYVIMPLPYDFGRMAISDFSFVSRNLFCP